mmetsp:Transcript_24457/g.33517  ORF Transcript_24457/g.33517 Transcript_24457/m.33517 type:complete len:226 (+) Transcript_24457:28-705(+)
MVLRMIIKVSRIPLRVQLYGLNKCFLSNGIDSISSELQFIKMPQIMDAKSGIVDKWLKKEGESFYSGENLCEVSLDDFSVAIDSPRSGIIADIMARKGENVAVGQPIVSFAPDKETYFRYLDSLRIADSESEKIAEVEEVNLESTKKPDASVLLREIKHLVKSGRISDKDFARKLQSMALKDHKGLMSLFTASFEGTVFNVDTFDVDFFLENAQELVKDEEDKRF